MIEFEDQMPLNKKKYYVKLKLIVIKEKKNIQVEKKENENVKYICITQCKGL